jgi:hypothetical protein
MNFKNLKQKLLFWIAVVVAAFVLWYGITVVGRTGLGQHKTFTSPDVLTGFYVGSFLSFSTIIYSSTSGSRFEKIVATVTSIAIAVIFSLYFLLHSFGYIKTWPYLYWLENGLSNGGV